MFQFRWLFGYIDEDSDRYIKPLYSTLPSAGFLLTKCIRSVHHARVSTCGSSTIQYTHEAALVRLQGSITDLLITFSLR